MKLDELLSELEEKARSARAVSSNWKTAHDDTFVSAKKVPEEHDWYWITGDMQFDDGYSASDDADLRGEKAVVQAHCRFIAAANPETVLRLIEIVRVQQEALERVKPALITYESKANRGLWPDSDLVENALSEAQRIAGGEEG